MSITLPFVKMSGTGNDFIVIDNRTGALADDRVDAFARRHCQRRKGVGSDGLLLLESDPDYAFRMRFINPDGGQVEMCGNGARCIVAFARQLGVVTEDPVTFRSGAGPITAWADGERIKLRMTDPSSIEQMTSIDLPPKGRQEIYFVNTGVAHAVVPIDDVSAIDVAAWGAIIRYHEQFAPSGTNANFLAVNGSDRIQVRTYERGVEDETLACGTGAVASALIAAMRQKMNSPITVLTRGQDELVVHFEGTPPHYSAAFLEGPTQVTFRGELDLDVMP